MKKISSIFKLIDYLSSKQKKEKDKYKSFFFFRIKVKREASKCE